MTSARRYKISPKRGEGVLCLIAWSYNEAAYDTELLVKNIKHEFLLCRYYIRKRLFLHIPVTLMEFFDASPTITPKKGVSNSLKEKREKEEKSGGGYMSHPTFE